MAHFTNHRRCMPHAARARRRFGMSSVEALVALTLLMTALTIAVPLIVRHNRLLVSARHYRLACEELANQIDRLTALPAEDVASALDDLTVSEFTAAHLPDAKLTGLLERADLGKRLKLAIVWNEPQRDKAPLTMAAWIFPNAPAPDDDSTDDDAEDNDNAADDNNAEPQP